MIDVPEALVQVKGWRSVILVPLPVWKSTGSEKEKFVPIVMLPVVGPPIVSRVPQVMSASSASVRYGVPVMLPTPTFMPEVKGAIVTPAALSILLAAFRLIAFAFMMMLPEPVVMMLPAGIS